MDNQFNADRRRFLGATAMTIAAARFGASAAGTPQSTFGGLKQIDAGVLETGFAEAGPAGGPPVVLLHGWPYDIHSYVEVAPVLAPISLRHCGQSDARRWFQ